MKNNVNLPLSCFKTCILGILFLFLHSAGLSQISNVCPPTATFEYSCNGSECFSQIDVSEIPDLPILTVNLDFHFVKENNVNFQCTNSGGNDYAPTYVQQILDEANDYLSAPVQNEIGNPPSPAIPDARIRFQLVGNPTDPCEAIFFHDVAPTTFSNSNALHIVIFDKSGYAGETSQENKRIWLYNLHNEILVTQQVNNATKWGPVLHHEFGHQRGLAHSFSAENSCPDMFPGLECGGPNPAVPSCTAPGNQTIICQNIPANTPYPYPYTAGALDCLPCYCVLENGNNFMGYNDSKRGMTRSQWAQMYGSMVENTPSFVDICANQSSATTDYFITEDTDWNSVKFLPEGVEVLAGAKLTIKCDVFVAEGKKIIVHRGAKLVVDGGRITNWCPGTRWAGICVHGNADLPQPEPGSMPTTHQAGVVYIDNFSTLEHAETAISTIAPGYSYPDQVARWGGVVYARESYFFDNRKAVELMPYNQDNKSHFTGCIFRENGEYANNTEGVTIWGCHGIEFKNCQFKGIDRSGIYGIDYAVKVFDNCQFEANEYGINAYSTISVPYNFDIGEEEVDSSGAFVYARNVFTNNEAADIMVDAAYASPGMLTVTRNDFNGSPRSTSIGPNCRADVRNNAFYNIGFWSILLKNSGLKPNKISCNDFTGVFWGVLAQNDNSQTEILENDYYSMQSSSASAEIRVYRVGTSSKAKIRSLQGGSGNPADNCFDVLGGTDISANVSQVDHFTYYYWNGAGTGSCLIPIVGNNNYSITATENGTDLICFSNRPADIAGEPPFIKENLTELRNLAVSALTEWQANPNDNAKGSYFYKVLDAKEYMLDWLLADFISQGNYSEAETLLAEENTKQARQELLGLKALHEDWVGMANVLNTYPIENQDDNWFVQVQNINLQRLSATTPFALSAQQELLLYQVALSYSPVRGYARGLLALLKDERIVDEDPEIEIEPREEQSYKVSIPALFYKIYPNPAQDEIIITYPIEVSEALFTMHDQYGRLTKSVRLDASGVLKIFARDFPNGLYFLSISNHDDILFRSKLAVSH